MSGKQTKRVRAWNIQVGDEISFFDTTKFRERVMAVVDLTDVSTTLYPIHLTMVLAGAKRKQCYILRFKRHQIVRVRRAS